MATVRGLNGAVQSCGVYKSLSGLSMYSFLPTLHPTVFIVSSISSSTNKRSKNEVHAPSSFGFTQHDHSNSLFSGLSFIPDSCACSQRSPPSNYSHELPNLHHAHGNRLRRFPYFPNRNRDDSTSRRRRRRPWQTFWLR